MKTKNDIAIIMGSDSDLPIVEECLHVLDEFKIKYSANVMSAHRTPNDVAAFASTARKNGIKVIIAAAGGAAHLAGVIAAHTTLPVIGIPIASTSLDGIDSLLATVQMPSGIPVGTVAIGKAGAYNAALLALQILSLSNKRIKLLLDKYKKDLVKKVHKKNANLQSKLQHPTFSQPNVNNSRRFLCRYL